MFARIEGEQSALEVADGEPVPPGFEDTFVQKQGVPQIQATLDCHKSSPLIGLEYLIELVPEERDQEPMYVCVLCDKKGDPRVTMAHLTSYNHSSKYIGINFPTANRAINSTLPRTKQGRRGGVSLVTKICSMIEEKHGRLTPLILRQEVYEARKEFYHRQIENGRHFRESATDNYMDLVAQDCLRPFSINLDEVPLPELQPPAIEDNKRKIAVDRTRLRSHATKDNDKKNMKKEADSTSDKKSNDRHGKPKKARGPRRNSLSSISSVSSSSLSRSPSPARSRSKSKTPASSPSPPPLTPRARSHRSNDRVGRRSANRSRNRSRSRSPRYGKRRSRSRSDSRSRYRDRGSSYNRRSPVASKLASGPRGLITERIKWERFRTDTDKIERDLTKTLRFHEKNPEKHPMYPEEWKKFWNMRYKELQAEGNDPSSHDFKPEWIKFWDKRMKEMHEEDFKMKKEELRLKLELPKDEPSGPQYIKRPRMQDVDDDIIVISPGPSTSRDAYTKSAWKNKSDSRERKRSLSPWDKDDAYQKQSRKPSWPPVRYPDKGRDRTVNYAAAPPRPYLEEDVSDPEPEGGARVVTVVRLLTALESQLGSFGPAVNQLLASALTMEKSRPGSSESMLANPDNLVFFETVKEKLKGQLFAGIVEHGLVMATKASIQNLADMLYRAEKMATPLKKVPKSTLLPIVATPAVTLPVHAEPVSVPGVGAMDKEAIAAQIAAALVAEGRANVTQEELESLINAVIGMAKASATLEKPITTAAFVSQMQADDPALASIPVATPPAKETSSLETLLSVVHSKPVAVAVKPDPPMISTKPVEETYKPASSCLFPSTVEKDEPVQRERTPSPPRGNKVGMNIEDMNMEDMQELTEADLKALLQNFKDLSTKEQYCLITYLKKIEATEPDRVENLRQFVNLPPSQPPDGTATGSDNSRPLSPFSLRLGRSNPTLDDSSRRYDPEPEVSEEKIKLDDSDDDDYSFDDIYEAASKKVIEKEKAAKELEQKKTNDALQAFGFEPSIDKASTEEVIPAKVFNGNDSGSLVCETDKLIANLMGNLPEKYAKKKTLTPSPSTAKPSTPVNVDMPARPNIGLNIDISNNLVDAANDFIPNAGMRSYSDVSKATPNSNAKLSPLNAGVRSVIDVSQLTLNSNAKISPLNASDKSQTMNTHYEDPSTVNSNLYDPAIHNVNNLNDQYGQQAFHDNQYPGNQPNFPNGQGYPQEYMQGGYPQAYAQQGYPGNYGGNYYAGTPQQAQFPPQQQQHPQHHVQQLGHPHQYSAPSYQQQQPQMGRGGFPDQVPGGFQQQAPGGFQQQAPGGYPQQRPGQPPYRPERAPQEYSNQYGGQGYNQYMQQPGYY